MKHRVKLNKKRDRSEEKSESAMLKIDGLQDLTESIYPSLGLYQQSTTSH